LSTADSSLLVRIAERTDHKEPYLDIQAISPVDVPYEANSTTIAARQLSTGWIVQVTTDSVYIIDLAGSKVLATWKDLEPSQNILVAACSEGHIVLGLSDGEILALGMNAEQTDVSITLHQ
jgi:hypothetical protein